MPVFIKPTTGSGSGSSDPLGEDYIWLTTPSGYGSTDNKIRKYTVTFASNGTALTNDTTAANGTRITVNEAGLYYINRRDRHESIAAIYGLSVNSTQLTTQIYAINDAHNLTFGELASAGYWPPSPMTFLWRFAANDIIRPHDDGALNNTGSQAYFLIVKVGD